MKIYLTTPNGIDALKRSTVKYRKSDKNKICQARYLKTEKSKRNRRNYMKQDKYREIHRRAKRLNKYGLTENEYQALLTKQNNACAICGYTQPMVSKFWPCIDHDHQTLIVRGLLCNMCNIGIGHFKENLHFLKNAVQYLENGGVK